MSRPRVHPWRRVAPSPRGLEHADRVLYRELCGALRADVRTPFDCLDVSSLPNEQRPTLAHGDQAPCRDRGFGCGADYNQGEEIRHTRSAWAGGW